MKNFSLRKTFLATIIALSTSVSQLPVLATTSNASNSSNATDNSAYTIPSNLKDEQVLRYNLGAEPKTLDPQLNAAMETSSLLSNLFLGLMKLGVDDKPVPAAAKSVDIND